MKHLAPRRFTDALPRSHCENSQEILPFTLNRPTLQLTCVRCGGYAPSGQRPQSDARPVNADELPYQGYQCDDQGAAV
jgi:hypothetical protein